MQLEEAFTHAEGKLTPIASKGGLFSTHLAPATHTCRSTITARTQGCRKGLDLVELLDWDSEVQK